MTLPLTDSEIDYAKRPAAMDKTRKEIKNMIRSFGPYFIIPKEEYPMFQQAYRLARNMTDVQIDEILEHRCHLHRNPTRKLKVIASDKCQISTSEIIDPTEKAWTK